MPAGLPVKRDGGPGPTEQFGEPLRLCHGDHRIGAPRADEHGGARQIG